MRARERDARERKVRRWFTVVLCVLWPERVMQLSARADVCLTHDDSSDDVFERLA